MKQGLSYISFCPLRILYNSKFILVAISVGTNAVVVTVHICHYRDLVLDGPPLCGNKCCCCNCTYMPLQGSCVRWTAS